MSRMRPRVNLFVGGLRPTNHPRPHGISQSFSLTFVQAELLSQILLRAYRVTLELGWSKEFIVASRARSHRRNLVPEPLENLETAFHHELHILTRPLNRRIATTISWLSNFHRAATAESSRRQIDNPSAPIASAPSVVGCRESGTGVVSAASGRSILRSSMPSV